MNPERMIASFDSASAMLRATSAFLHGKDIPALDVMPRSLTTPARALGALVNTLPQPAKEQVYIWSGWRDAVPEKHISRVDVEAISRWAVDRYPDRDYPAIMIGSSNGALVHLCAAMGIPWLPQTLLIPVRRSGPDPDKPSEDMEWGLEPARALLDANPDVVLHHMHDPNQDRLMIRRMSYFRVKKQRLGKAYEQFILRNLAPGGILYLVDCRLKWPTLKLQQRHYFQFGALGGASIEEYREGGQRVRDYLHRYGSPLDHWDAPRTDGESAEAEWGFDWTLGEEIAAFADRHGFRVKTLSFGEPEDMSPLVADFYRELNRKRGIEESLLLVESFILLEPYWTLRGGLTPYWLVFNKEPSATSLETYLDHTDFDEILLTLFSHGVESVGLVPLERWKRLLERAGDSSQLIGVDEDDYPRDFAVFPRFHDRLVKSIQASHPFPPAVPPAAMEQFFADHLSHLSSNRRLSR